METLLDLGDRMVPVIVRVNRRARRLIVKVDSVGDRVVVTAPSKRALPDALRFAESKRAWIRARLASGAPARPFVAGGVCPYESTPHCIVNSGSARTPVVRRDGAPPTIVVGGAIDHLNRRLVDWLKREARRVLTERVDAHAARLGKRRGVIRIRDTRSRWGSCSSEGDLSFSWRLILAPPAMLDYVAAHECAHLVHLDHSPAYWRTLDGLGVNVEAARRWFADHGTDLHAWGTPSRRLLEAA